MKRVFFESFRASNFTGVYADKEQALLMCKEHYPTGFKALDEATEGGISEGLAIIGAGPGGGKSTFAFQFGYHVAQTVPVIIISLEMTREDIIAKLISMETYLDNSINTNLAISATKLRSRPFIENASDDEMKCIRKACDKVTERLQNVFIVDSTSKITDVNKIIDVVEGFIDLFGQKPVLIIDYLQFLSSPENTGFSIEKEKLDHALSSLHTLADKRKILVFMIASYDKKNISSDKPDLSVFCGTSRIAYDADSIFALNFKDKDVTPSSVNSHRDIELTILKQRFGRVGVSIPLSFYAEFNYFDDQYHSVAIEEAKKENPEELFRQEKLSLDDYL